MSWLMQLNDLLIDKDIHPETQGDRQRDRQREADTWNQSMVQQLISDGNMRSLLRKASPMGLIASTMCRFCLTRSTKKLYIDRGVTSNLRLCTTTDVASYAESSRIEI